MDRFYQFEYNLGVLSSCSAYQVVGAAIPGLVGLHYATTYTPATTRRSSPSRAIAFIVLPRFFSTPSNRRVCAGLSPSGCSWSSATMRRVSPPVAVRRILDLSDLRLVVADCGACRGGAGSAVASGTAFVTGVVSRSRAASSSRCNTSTKRSSVRVSAVTAGVTGGDSSATGIVTGVCV